MKLKISVTFKIKRRRTKTEHPEIKEIFCENAQQFEVFENNSDETKTKRSSFRVL